MNIQCSDCGSEIEGSVCECGFHAVVPSEPPELVPKFQEEPGQDLWSRYVDFDSSEPSGPFNVDPGHLTTVDGDKRDCDERDG